MKRLVLLFLVVIIFGDSQFEKSSDMQIDNSFNIHFGTIHRVKDLSFIKVPFRLANYSNKIAYKDFELTSNFALEFSIKDPILDSFFTPEIREIYLSWYVPFGQFNFGNIIHSWGILSNNSPTDNLSPVNYYYIFSRGTERKIPQLSFTGDIYFDSHSLGFIFNPQHKGTEIPFNDSELPINVPLPDNPTINQVNDLEYGAKYKYSGNLFDLELSYFNGYDKTMSSLGANLWKASKGSSALESTITTYVDTVLAYRKTEVLGLGFSTFISDVTLKTEFAYFFTDDLTRNPGELSDQLEWSPYPDIYRKFPGTNDDIYSMCEPYYDWSENSDGCTAKFDQSFHMGTRAEYMQYVLEFEYPLFFDIQLSAQFIFHDLINISIGLDGEIEEDKIATVQTGTIDLLPEHNFIPGMGSPLTIFTLQEYDREDGTVNLTKSRTVYLNLKKFLWDYTLETNLRTFFDVINKGSFIEVEGIYDLNDYWKISSAINFITGNKNSGDSYPFNPMQDFSHFRVEFIYSF